LVGRNWPLKLRGKEFLKLRKFSKEGNPLRKELVIQGGVKNFNIGGLTWGKERIGWRTHYWGNWVP